MAQYELPENLSALSDDELNAALNDGLDAFKGLGITAESDEDTIAEGERIAPLVQAVRAEQQARVAAAESRAARAAELLATVPEQTAEVTESEEEAPVAEAEVAVEEEAPTTTIENEESVVSDNIPEPVAASAAQSPVARAAQNAPEQPVPTRRAAATLIASADVSGFVAGAEMDDLGVVGQALISRLKGLPRTPSPSPVMQRFGAATIRKDFGEFTQGNQYDDYDLLQTVAREARLPGGSLVAAGGWCSPSETVYDMCQLETVSNLLDLPEMNISRGGLRYTPGPDFSAIYSACGFLQTETDATNGVCKTCCEVTCPSFTDVRLDAIGLCVKVPILTNAAYPELVRRFVEGSLVAHAYKVNKYLIDKIVADAGTAVVADAQGSASFGLDSLEWEATALRQKFRLGDNATIEIVAPVWYKHLIRMDVARRNGQDWNSVTDAQVESNFSARNLRVQWVYGYQELTVPTRPSATPTDVPANVQVLMYPAGTWVKGTADVISMDAVYDSVGLESNTFTGIFVEEGILAVQRCAETWAVTLDTCAGGLTGQQKAVCLGTAFA
jgi:hypothetical protein